MTDTSKKTPKFLRQISTVVLTGLILLTSAGVSKQAGLASSVPQKVVPSSKLMAQSDSLPPTVEQKVRQSASQQLKVPSQDVKIVGFTRQTWSDGCLGLGGAAESCLQAIVEGWRVEVTNGQQNLFYRTDGTANAIRLEPQPDVVTLPADVSQRLLQTVARQVRVPVSRLRVAAVKPATWDGCLGIYKPGQACTRIAISGWQAIVTGGDRSWVYHLDQAADRIVQNSTASGSRGELVPSFMPEENKPVLEANIVFQSIVSGGLMGKVTQITLTNDGVITQLISAPNIRSRPVVLKRLSQQQLKQFQQVLEAKQFRNLNGLSYLSSAAFADYPTTMLQATGSTVQYIDLEMKNLPPALRQVIQAWKKL
ncbi:hypothetical protein H6F76_13965 [Leptolyngbya sp. FACHB-321]|uniref:hypothetical protein n=1 Tax=Leptolyngbya sp. FACHB-321 TaxID=2692807 RepID=UPI0016826531|nr:hypothetical protein [Leptolyngbya sp. FACHB-321]MBD2036126.1 hypothetical protein [Leptolyngbya sp. FACHB-321]